MPKTSKKDFELFKQECQKWIEVFGLKGWEVNYCHEPSKVNRAEFSSNLKGRAVSIWLSTTWTSPVNDYEIRKSAFHEVQHIFLGRLMALAEYRYTTAFEINEEVHAIIRTLENVVFE